MNSLNLHDNRRLYNGNLLLAQCVEAAKKTANSAKKLHYIQSFYSDYGNLLIFETKNIFQTIPKFYESYFVKKTIERLSR